MDKPSKDGSSQDNWSPGLGSGPANHFFYLLSEDSGARTVNGVNYDSPTYDDGPVTGIGIENAAIWYRPLTTYMVSTTNYASARTATLFGTYSPTYLAVADAWAAINVARRLTIGVNPIPTADQTSGVSLQLDAHPTNTGATLTYEATGLPLDAGELISGTPTTLGASDVTLKITDSTGATASDTFSWQIGNIYTNNTHLDIPDRVPAAESPVKINTREGNASTTTSIYVNTIHPWRGDLAVDFDQTFTLDASTQPLRGTWKLRIQDQLTLSSGYLVRWHLVP